MTANRVGVSSKEEEGKAMAVKCGWASIDENQNLKGGKAGDQTGKEVKVGNWYDFGQTAVYRWKDRSKAKKFATIIKYWCEGNRVGYDQNQRTTLGAWCKAHKWDYKVTASVETDCSRMVADGINCVQKKEVFGIGATFYTGNLGDKLMATGLFTKLTGSKYCDQDAYLMTGDIINNPARHVIVALANGSKAKETASKSKANKSTAKKTNGGKKSVATLAQEVIDGKWGTGTDRKKKLTDAGYDYAAVQSKVNELSAGSKTGGVKILAKGTVKPSAGLNVRDKASLSGKVLKALPKGTAVKCYQSKKAEGSTWWKISPDVNQWVVAKYITKK